MDVSVGIPQSEQPALVGKNFRIRAASYVIDSVVVFIVRFVATIMMSFVIGIVLAILGTQPSVRQTTFWENLLVGTPATIAYYFLFEWLFGATAGKLILGMRVVKEDGSPCDARAAIVRALYRFIDGLFFALPAYNSMKPPLQQRLGDKSAKTVVVDLKQVSGGSQAWWRFAVAALLNVMVELGVGAVSVILALN